MAAGRKRGDRSSYELKWTNKRALQNKERKRAARDAKAAPADDLAPWSDSAWIVVELHGNGCDVMRAREHLECAIPEDFLAKNDLSLAIGDRVSIDEEHRIVTGRFVRRSKLVRMREDRTRRSSFGAQEHVLAANVDIACIVATVADPPFHPRLLDRYLVMCQNGGIQPLICINKCDLAVPRPNLEMYEAIGIPIVFVSATTGEALDSLRERLRNSWSVLVGHSGVGKTSLINGLVGNEDLHTAAVSERSKRGRHTTTASSVHEIEEHTYLIDTPGIRSWGLWSIDKNILREYFPEFTQYAPSCRYRDCTHTTEPACAVVSAVDAGLLPRARYESYLRMFRSLE